MNTMAAQTSFCVDETFLNSGLVFRWQVIMLLLSTTTKFHTGSAVVGPSFYAMNVPYTCATNPNATNQDTCEEKMCDEWLFNYTTLDVSTSIQESYNFVCNREILLKIHGSLFFLGLLIGSFVGGYVSDRIGRVKTLSLCYFIHTIFGILMGVTNFYIVHFVCWAVISICIMTAWLVVFVYGCEIAPAKNRHFIILLFDFGFSAGVVISSPLNLLLPNWRHMILANTFLAFVAFITSLFLNESPVWLWNMERYKESCSVIQSAVKLSGNTIPKEMIQKMEEKSRHGLKKLTFLGTLKTDCKRLFSIYVQKSQNDFGKKHPKYELGKRYSLIDIFRHRTLTIRVFLLSAHWIAGNTLYYGLLFGALLFKQQLHVYMVLSGIGKSIGSVLILLLLHFIGRRTAVLVCLSLLGILFGCCVVLPLEFYYVILAIVVIATFAAGSLFNLCYMWSAELMPTVVRTSGSGFASMAARVTGLALPYISLLGNIWEKLPFLFYSLFAFSTIICTVFLPETRGKSIPHTLKDGNVSKAEFERRRLPLSFNSRDDEEEKIRTDNVEIVNVLTKKSEKTENDVRDSESVLD